MAIDTRSLADEFVLDLGTQAESPAPVDNRDSNSVWAAVMDAVDAEPTAGRTFFQQTRYPGSRYSRRPVPERRNGILLAGLSFLATLMLAVGLASVWLTVQMDQ